jgi:ferredoxin-NADP reductase
MARAALLERLTVARAPIVWRVATVRATTAETPHARTLRLDVPDWPGHRAGQHVDVRLTADDGYQAQRSYSIASAPEDDGGLALTVERIDDGEVSPYLTDEVRAGDELELRGPVGGHFTWRVQDGGPLLLVAGGSGLVPLMAMLRHLAAHDAAVDARLPVSSRGWEDVLYRAELSVLAQRPGVQVHHTLTRGTPPGWDGFDGRVDADMLRAVGPRPDRRPHVFVCGPTGFVERAADLLLAVGHPPQRIRAERFGPTGG